MGPLAFPASSPGWEWGQGGLCISMSRLRLLFLLVAGHGWGTVKSLKKSHSGPLKRGPSRPPPSQDTFFEMGGHLMSLFLPFVWLHHQPSVAAWPLSSPSPFSPFPALLTCWETFPWKRASRGGGGKSRGSDTAAVGEQRKINNRQAQGVVTKRGHEWKHRQGF